MLALVSCKSRDESDLSADLEVVNVQSDRIFYESLEQVEDNATLIVEANVKEVLGQKASTHYDYGLEMELPGAGYTKYEIEVTKVYKGDVNVGDKLVLLQGYYIWTNSEGKKQLITISSNKPAEKGKDYIMFLQYYEPHEGYWPVADYQGIFPIPTEEMIRKVHEDSLKQSDLDVYDIEALHYLLPIYKEVVQKYFNDNN